MLRRGSRTHTMGCMSDETKIRISAVLFDYGMVLSGPPDQHARQHMERIFGVDEETFRKAYWKYRDAYDRGTLVGLSYWNCVAHDLSQTLDSASLSALIDADNALWTQPNLPMIDWASSLQRAGIKTGILSNIGDAMEAGIRARFPWLAEFAHHTFSHRLGIAKPDEAIYRHAAEGLGVPVGEILFVDDREENILAARAAGMTAVQYTGHAAFMDEMQRLGLGELLALERG
jgi:putative hydrolase of the HAD superfamily